MPKPHWFPFYVRDFLSSPTVTLMTAEEVGGYLLLLCYAWQDPKGSLPSDDDSLRVLSRVRGDMTRIKSCFKEKNGRIYNERLAQELDKAKEKSDVAKKSSVMRWQSERNANAMRTQSSSQSQSQSQSQSESPPQTEKEVKTCRAGETFAPPANGIATWNAYNEAYLLRYGVAPVRNQRTNSQLFQVVKRLGSTEAPQVATFYLQHNKALYVSNRHPTNLLLRDAEGLRTEWATGIRATHGEAKNAEQMDEARAQVKRVEAMLKGGL